MKLQGQHGYAMAALLIGLSIMALLMTAVMPVWKQTSQREKEAELVFRGTQYVHAIQLFQRKSGPGTYPPSFDVLVQQKFLRKKYKDPITNGDFVPLPAAVPTPPNTPGSGTSSTSTPSATSATGPQTGAAAPAGSTGNGTTASQPFTLGGSSGTTVPGGIAGVMSKSTDASIRIYNGQTHYNEWVFRFLPPAPAAGAAAPGGAGQRGAAPNQPPAGGPGGIGRSGRGQARGLRGGPAGGQPPGGRAGGPITLPDGRVVTPTPDGRGGFSIPLQPPGR